MDPATISALAGALVAIVTAVTALIKLRGTNTTAVAAHIKAKEATDNAYSAIYTARQAQLAIDTHVNPPIPEPDPLPKGE